MSLTALAHKHWLNAVTAMLFAIAFWRLGFSPELPAVLAFIFGGALLAVIDWKATGSSFNSIGGAGREIGCAPTGPTAA